MITSSARTYHKLQISIFKFQRLRGSAFRRYPLIRVRVVRVRIAAGLDALAQRVFLCERIGQISSRAQPLVVHLAADDDSTSHASQRTVVSERQTLLCIDLEAEVTLVADAGQIDLAVLIDEGNRQGSLAVVSIRRVEDDAAEVEAALAEACITVCMIMRWMICFSVFGLVGDTTSRITVSPFY